MKWDDEVDLLVAGSGMGGLTAALVGAVEGLAVLLCEKGPRIGGTTATSGGAIWIVGSTEARAAGSADTIEDARRYLSHELGNHYREELVEAYLESGKAAVDYLRENSEVRFKYWPMPDYHSDDPGGTSAGRLLGTQEFDGRRLGRDFERVQPPIRRMMVFGGMMFNRDEVPLLMRAYSSWKGVSLAVRLVLRHLSDRIHYSRGTRIVLGNAMVARFLYSLLQRKVPIWTSAPVIDLIHEGGRILGAVVDKDGGAKRIRTRLGVVLATGGVAHNQALLRELTPDFPHEHTLAYEGDTGDGFLLARKAGGVADDNVVSPAVWTPASIMPESDGSTSILPYGYLDRGKPGAIAVNSRGRRFVNEADSYQDVVFAMYRDRAEDGLRAYLICDRDFIHDYGFGLVPPNAPSINGYIRAGYLKRGRTLKDLAKVIGVDGDALEHTVEEHNEYALTGHDLAFGKGNTAFNRFFGDPANKPNPCLRPLRKGPFFALVMYPTTLGMSVGLKTDGNARVLDRSDQPITGLWACGNDMTSVMRGYCPAGGVTLGPALVFGYRAAMDAAAMAAGARQAA